MRTILILLLAASQVGADPEEPKKPHEAELEVASADYFHDVDAARAKYRSKLAAILERADAVELYRFDGTTDAKAPEGKEADYFPIVPDRQVSKIKARKRLIDGKLTECRKAAAVLLTKSEASGLLCHYPAHGVRFFLGDEVIFETSICWKCQNYYVAYPGNVDASWEGIASAELKEFLQRELPLPTEGETPEP